MDSQSIVDATFQQSYLKLTQQLFSGAISQNTFDERFDAIMDRRKLEVLLLLEAKK